MASGWDFLSGFFGNIDENVKARDEMERKKQLEEALMKLRAETDFDLHKRKGEYDRANTFTPMLGDDGYMTFIDANGKPKLDATGQPARVKADAKTYQEFLNAKQQHAESEARIRQGYAKLEIDRSHAAASNEAQRANAQESRSRAKFYDNGGGTGNKSLDSVTDIDPSVQQDLLLRKAFADRINAVNGDVAPDTEPVLTDSMLSQMSKDAAEYARTRAVAGTQEYKYALQRYYAERLSLKGSKN